MRSALKRFLVVALLVATACDEGEDDFGTDSSTNMAGAVPGLAGGSDAAAPGTAAGGPGGTTGGMIAWPGATTGGPGGNTGGAPDATVAVPGGAASGLADSGVGSAPDGGSGIPGGTQGGIGGGDAGSSGPGPSVTGPEPVLPKPSMPCPVFQSGTTMYMGLSVEVYAGPKSTGKKGPLVFHWHGTGGQGKDVETSPFGGADGAGLPAEVRAEILAEGGIIISPTDNETVREGTDVTFLLGVWYTPGDFKMADHFAACAVEQHDIDPRRIYTTGCSAGGLMAGVMTFNRSSYLAASAPNSGGVVAILPGMTTFQDAHVPALMTMHGDRAQDEVIVNFEDTSVDADNAAVAKGGFVINCNHGGGHCGAPKPLKLAMWQFMKDHPFGVSPEPYANGLPPIFPSYCKIIKR